MKGVYFDQQKKMNYIRIHIQIESPEQMLYENIEYNLTECSITDMKLGNLNINLQELVIAYRRSD
jgi:hypothetical protein